MRRKHQNLRVGRSYSQPSHGEVVCVWSSDMKTLRREASQRKKNNRRIPYRKTLWESPRGNTIHVYCSKDNEWSSWCRIIAFPANINHEGLLFSRHVCHTRSVLLWATHINLPVLSLLLIPRRSKKVLHTRNNPAHACKRSWPKEKPLAPNLKAPKH